MGNAIFLFLRGPWRIPIQFDASLLILTLLLGALYIDRGISAAAITFSMIVLVILLHELGHAAACVVQRIPVLPLDGGRLLHSWLHHFVRGITANKITGGIGLALSILWIPLMFVAYVTFGFVLLYFPSITLHWRMFRSGVA